MCGPARADGQPNIRCFGTTTDQLQELADWLADHRVESVAMESTSVYWIPTFELLESRGIEALLVNAHQLHNVPGRKTDISDGPPAGSSYAIAGRNTNEVFALLTD